MSSPSASVAVVGASDSPLKWGFRILFNTIEGGYRGRIPSRASELGALKSLIARAERGDICVVMAHVERRELFDWLSSHGFSPVSPPAPLG